MLDLRPKHIESQLHEIMKNLQAFESFQNILSQTLHSVKGCINSTIWQMPNIQGVEFDGFLTQIWIVPYHIQTVTGKSVTDTTSINRSDVLLITAAEFPDFGSHGYPCIPNSDA